MNLNNYIAKNRSYYNRFYLLISAAAFITFTVLIGSLIIGESVRNTLINRVGQRLGDTETVLFTNYAFIDDRILSEPLFEQAEGYLLSKGFLAIQGKLIPVNVWGTDKYEIGDHSLKINEPLARELQLTPNSRAASLVLRLPAAGFVPSGSLFVTDNYTTSLRLSFDGIVPVSEGGNISLKNEQTLPFNVFLNRNELAGILETDHKINILLSNTLCSEADLKALWEPALGGLNTTLQDGFTEITHENIFIPDTIVRSLSAARFGNRLFSYLANSIEKADEMISYSFVTAIDRYQGVDLLGDEIILSDYAAERLHARTGDSIRLSFYVSDDLKQLQTKTAGFIVKRIVPLQELHEDQTLSASFPGISTVARCTDWNSDLPLDMSLITEADEAYWTTYKTTPKVLIPYESIRDTWKNVYGSATAIRFYDETPDLSGLTPDQFGVQIIHPRTSALFAAMHGVDFSGLFIALAFFIIIAALLLLVNPLSEMLYKRKDEIHLLQSFGFSNARISHLIWKETAPVIILSALAGVAGGFAYTTLILWMLETLWQGATHTDGFTLYTYLPALILSVVILIGLVLLLVKVIINQQIKKKAIQTANSANSRKSRKYVFISCGIISVALILINYILLQSVVLFVVCGLSLLITAAAGGDYLIYKNATSFLTDSSGLIWKTIYANRKQALLSWITLSTGVFIVFAVGLNRKDFSDDDSLIAGTGGYSLWMETIIPLYHNLNTTEGKNKLGLNDLPENTHFVQALKYAADEASCLNLNKVSTPHVLGINLHEIENSAFKISNFIQPDTTDYISFLTQKQNTAYPVLVDETVLTWSLGKALGDTLWYQNAAAEPVALLLAGTLPNTIFQGHILMDYELFKSIWPGIAGTETALIQSEPQSADQIKALLSTALSEYGISLITTNDRLRQFNSVTDTYLTIFMTLGCIGLLLGIMCFIIIIRKQMTMRKSQIQLYLILGYTTPGLYKLYYKENLMIPLYAFISGFIAALLSIGPAICIISLLMWGIILLFSLLFILCVLLFIRFTVRKEIRNNHINIVQT